MIYKNFEEKYKSNLFTLISYTIFIVAFLLFIYDNYVVDRPLKVFENIFEITNVDIISKAGINIFNTHKEYKKYYKKIKNAKNNVEKYNLIREFLQKYKSIYIGYIDIKASKEISRIKRNKLKDKFTIKHLNFDLNNFENIKPTKNAIYVKISSLWSDETLKILLDEIKKSQLIILDIRNFPFGKEENYLTLYSSFLPSDLKWYKNNYGDIVQQKVLSLGKYKKIHYTGNVILLTNEKTSEINGLFLCEILDNIDKYNNFNIYYIPGEQNINISIFHLSYPPLRGVRYYILNNGSILYYPVSEFLNSRYKKIESVNKNPIKIINESNKLKMYLIKNGIY